MHDCTENDQSFLISIHKTIKSIHDLTKNLYERTMQIQNNFKKIITLSSQWKNVPMYSREKNTRFITFDHRLSELKITRFTEVGNASIKIQQLLKENLLLFNNIPLVDLNWSK